MINPMDLSGKTILITGASSGIGQETCRCVSELGARVVLVARDKERLAQTLDGLSGAGHRAEVFDLAEADAIPSWLEGLAKAMGPLDGVVHSAGISRTQPIRIWNVKDTDEMLKINLYPCFALAKALRKKSCHRTGSSLVFVSSVAGIKGEAGLAVYAASKAAVNGLVKSLARELVPDGIRVNCVAPAMVRTPMAESLSGTRSEAQMAGLALAHPMGFGEPRDVANAVAFLLAETSRWITGTTIVTDGGYTA